jgi:hypothetical protein
MATKGILATVLLLLVGCGSDVSVSTTRNEPAVESSAETAPGTTSDKSSDTPPFAPEELGPTLAAYSRRLEARIDRAAGEIEMGEQTNQIRRNTLHWRIRTAEFVGESLGRSNAVVSMVELWYLTVSMQAFYDQGPGKAAFGSHQSIAQDTIRRLRTEAEGIVKRVLAPERFTKMKTEITGAVGRGELFAASQIEQGNILSDLLSVSHLQTLLSIPLAPFDALNGVSKGSDALHELAGVGARAVELAARYPRLLTWYIQLMSVEIQEQDAAKSALADLHSLSISAKELGDTAKELPVRMRVEATALLESSKDVQKTTQGTLERAQATADALDRAAHSLDLLVHSVDGFIATFRPQPGAPPAPAKPEKNQQPFDIRDYTAAIQATESSASGEQLLDHLRLLDAGQLAVEALEAVGEALVVEAEQVQHRGVEVADVHGILDDVVGEVVGLAVDRPAFHAAAGHPHREAARVVIAPVVLVVRPPCE